MYKYLDEVNIAISKIISEYNINKTSESFYIGRINSFFKDYMSKENNKDKPLNAITYFDVDYFLQNLSCSDSEKVNCYCALKRFFEYTYLKGITKEIMSKVKKPFYKKLPFETLTEDNYMKLKSFITDKKNDIYSRLILGLFIFTGLSRKYIYEIRNNDFIFEDGIYKLRIWKDEEEEKEEVILPLKSELQLIVNDYCNSLKPDERLNRFVKHDSNYLSTYISNITKKIFTQKCTPTILCNTFISLALAKGNCVWEVSTLTLESITTIEKHIVNEKDLFYKQTSILNNF